MKVPGVAATASKRSGALAEPVRAGPGDGDGPLHEVKTVPPAPALVDVQFARSVVCDPTAMLS